MYQDLFNRHSVSVAEVLGNATNYLVFTPDEKKLFEPAQLTLKPKNSALNRVSLRLDHFPRLRIANPSWDSRVSRPNSNLEDWKIDKKDCTCHGRRTESRLDTRKESISPFRLAASMSRTPSRCRGKGRTSVYPALRMMEEHAILKVQPRSASVQPVAKHLGKTKHRVKVDFHNTLNTALEVVPSNGLSGKALTLSGRQGREVLRLSTPTCNRIKMPIDLTKPISNIDDSPHKRQYKKILQRTSKQMEDENLQGWD